MPNVRAIDVAPVLDRLAAIRARVGLTMFNDPMPSKRLAAACVELDRLLRELPTAGVSLNADEERAA